MGTCYHFAAMGIKEVQAIMNLSPAMFYDYMRQEMPEACNEKERYVWIGNLFRELAAIGDREDEFIQGIRKNGRPLFNHPETYKEYIDCKPYIVGRQGIEWAVQIYEDETARLYRNILSPGQGECAQAVRQRQFFARRLCLWEKHRVVSFQKHGHRWNHMLQSSCLETEYLVFEFARIFWAVDWENETLVLYED